MTSSVVTVLSNLVMYKYLYFVIAFKVDVVEDPVIVLDLLLAFLRFVTS